MNQGKAVTLQAKKIKATLVLDPAQLLRIQPGAGSDPVPFAIHVGDRTVTGQFNAKTLRRALATIRENGGVATFVQGALVDDGLKAARISVQVKTQPSRS